MEAAGGNLVINSYLKKPSNFAIALWKRMKDEDKFQKCYFFMDTTDAMPLSSHFCVSVAQGAGVILGKIRKVRDL